MLDDKQPFSKGYVLHSSIEITFLKRQSFRNGGWMSDCWGLGTGGVGGQWMWL